MLKTLCISTLYQLLIFFRVKQGVFFAIVFPVFLFILFGKIWGNKNPEYIGMLLAGVIGMTIAGDGIFAIGPVIKNYYSEGLIKYLRKLPHNALVHFVGLILSRIIVLASIIPVLCLLAFLVFGYKVTLTGLLNYLSGMVVGLFIFSFLGLCFNFSGIKNQIDKGLSSLFYYIVLFTSDAFYPVSYFNEFLGFTGNLLPLNPVLSLLKGDGFAISLLPWGIIPMLLFILLFRKVKFDRS